MEDGFPKRLFTAGNEPLAATQINNSCKMSLISKIKDVLPAEYNEVKNDSVFSHILAIHENCLGYSGRLIHSILCRQLITEKKYEIWCVFGGRPLRFSLQEFYAVTGLKYKVDKGIYDLEKWKDDNGFWSKLLKRKEKISIKKLFDKHLADVKKSNHVDKIRFVYVCVIAGLIMAKDEKKEIPHIYIKLVMDIRKVQTYPWGLEAFEVLVKSIIEKQSQLKNLSYILDGFSYAFQIWVMEAIPNIGSLLGRKLDNDLTQGPRCSNWTGAAKVSYDDIILLESTFGINDVIYPYISFTGILDICESSDFSWPKEITDARVYHLNAIIRSGKGFGDHVWESSEADETTKKVDEDHVAELNKEDLAYENKAPNVIADDTSVSDTRRGKKKFSDQGAEKRKRKILCQRAAEKHGELNENMKSFIQSILTASFTSLENKIDNFHEQMVKLKIEVSQLKESLITAGNPRNAETSTTSKPSTTNGAKAEKSNGVPSNVFTALDDVILSQSCGIYQNMGTQEYLQKCMGRLSQVSVVNEIDPTQRYIIEEKNNGSTAKSPFLEEVYVQPVNRQIPEMHTPYVGDKLKEKILIDSEMEDNRKNFGADYPLVFVSKESFDGLMQWSSKRLKLPLGPSFVEYELLNRIMNKREWLRNEDMDAVMYLFRENTSLGRWNSDRVAFMNCLFGVQIKKEFEKFKGNRRGYALPNLLLDYGNGELPSHGRTRKRWATEIDHIYVPLNVNGGDNKSNVEPFKQLIPRLVKAVQTTSIAKQLTVMPYSVIDAPLQHELNKSSCDCGVFPLKFIECHLLGFDLSLINDDNIREARVKIAVDLWQAANDPILVARMLEYEPPKINFDIIDID